MRDVELQFTVPSVFLIRLRSLFVMREENVNYKYVDLYKSKLNGLGADKDSSLHMTVDM